MTQIRQVRLIDLDDCQIAVPINTDQRAGEWADSLSGRPVPWPPLRAHIQAELLRNVRPLRRGHW